MPRLHLLPLLSFFAFAPTVSGCGVAASIFGGDGTDRCAPSPEVTAPAEEPEPSGIRPFTSEGELDAYVAEIEARAEADRRAAEGCSAGAADDVPGMAESSGAAPAAPNENVTNNQEAGVDEGGIVKNIGDALVVLRQGRLYAVDVGEGRAPTLTDSIPVARTESLDQGVWYDEMLVSGDRIYVIGYRYHVPGARGATEVDSFRLSNGKLTRLRSIFLESNDYYSGRNYASRMTGGKLVFYMPHYVGRKTGTLSYPRVLEADDDGKFTDKGPIFGALDVWTSLVKPRSATFHTVVQCALPEDGSFDCKARSVIGSWWREHYVSPDAVYLWARTHVYRFDFATLDVSAHRAEGYPVDQFSFRQTATDLLVAANVPADASKPWQSSSTAKLERLPLAAFDKKGEQVDLPQIAFAPDAGITRNRFVGDTLIAAIAPQQHGGYYGYASSGATGEIVSVDATTAAVTRAPAPYVLRLEPLGEGRVLVVSGGTEGLSFDAYAVANLGASLGHLEMNGLREGEGRSHGFFYKPGASGEGIFGYAVINPPSYGAGWGWGNGISNIGFFRVAAAGALAPIGIVSAGQVETDCETSCIDWYGNTRPVFLRDRTFALMGSELAEVTLGAGATKGAAAELRATP